MGGDGGEGGSTGGFSSEGISGETGTNSSGELSSSETSSSDSSSVELSSGEVADAFSESDIDEDINTDSDIEIDANITQEESDAVFGEDSCNSEKNVDFSDSSTENDEENNEHEIASDDITDTEKESVFNENDENPETDQENSDKLENEITIDEGNGEISETDISDLPPNVQDSFHSYENEGWTGPHNDCTPGTRGGGEFANRDGDLPTTDANGNPISYKEFDVNDKPIDGSNRDGERFVIGSDGSVYYTGDHYDSFTKIK